MQSDQRSDRVLEYLEILKASMVRRIAFAAAILSLIATPIFIFIAALTIGTDVQRAERFTPFCFPVWAVFTVWVILDAPALLRLVGPRPDPLGSKSLQLSALGIANLAAMFLFLIVTKGK